MYKRAEQTIVLCEAAKTLVCETYGIPADRVHVIHNWADPRELTPKPKPESDFARQHGLIEPFTLMYSGNLGLYYEFETVLKAAETLKNENFRLVLVGSGGRKGWIAEEIRRRNLTNTLLLPYQPFERLSDSLSASDAQLVTIAKGIEGISFPSKLYSAMAVARPIVALSEPRSEMRQIVEENRVGRWSEVGDADALVTVLRSMMADREECRRMGENARRTLEEKFTISVAAKAYGEVLSQAADRR
jgi:glycosyltransferase involved in cell wall biosynthesis